MADVTFPGFESSNVFASMKSNFDGQSAEEKQALLKKVKKPNRPVLTDPF